MYRKFDDLTDKAETGKKSSIRALQAWQYLIGCALRRQLVRYGELADMMGYSDNRPLTNILGHLMHYCNQHDLPPLTVIVVNQDGTPGQGFTEIPQEEFDAARERVFDFPWFEIVPPSFEELQLAWAHAMH